MWHRSLVNVWCLYSSFSFGMKKGSANLTNFALLFGVNATCSTLTRLAGNLSANCLSLSLFR